jgi:hypothetical protein
MTANSDIVETIIQKFTQELKNQAALSYAGHKNLWVDLGADLTQGGREICNHVEDMLHLLVINLPEDINEIIWSESWGGKAKLNDIMQGLNPSSYDFSAENNTEADDLLADIVEYLKDKLFLAAEIAYADNPELESAADYTEDDFAEEDEDEDEYRDENEEE